MAASVKQRLLNLAKKQGEDFNFLLGRFAVERFLFRLAQSSYATDFVLKGAMLFHPRATQIPHRPTLGWTLSVDRDINEAGQIVGYGINQQGQTHAFLLIPIHDPRTLFLIVLTFVGFSILAIRRRRKIHTKSQ